MTEVSLTAETVIVGILVGAIFLSCCNSETAMNGDKHILPQKEKANLAWRTYKEIWAIPGNLPVSEVRRRLGAEDNQETMEDGRVLVSWEIGGHVLMVWVEPEKLTALQAYWADTTVGALPIDSDALDAKADIAWAVYQDMIKHPDSITISEIRKKLGPETAKATKNGRLLLVWVSAGQKFIVWTDSTENKILDTSWRSIFDKP